MPDRPSPPAYLVAEVTVTDPAAFAAYAQSWAATMAPFGGKIAAPPSGRMQALEGKALPERVIILEFPSYEQALAFWTSPAYREVAAIRHRSAEARIFLIEGASD